MPESLDYESVIYKCSVKDTGKFIFSQINLIEGELTIINEEIDTIINAVGYNILDGLMYGVEGKTGTLYSIDKKGILTNIKRVPNFPTHNKLITGAIDDEGHLFAYDSLEKKYYTVDVNKASNTFGELVDPKNNFEAANETYGIKIESNFEILDWVFSNDEKSLLAINNEGSIVGIDTKEGTIIEVSAMGLIEENYGIYSDINGNIYLIDSNGDNEIYKVYIEENIAIVQPLVIKKSKKDITDNNILESILDEEVLENFENELKEGNIDEYLNVLDVSNLKINEIVLQTDENSGKILTYIIQIENSSDETINNVFFQKDILEDAVYIGNLGVSTLFTGIDPQKGIVITTILGKEMVTISWQVRMKDLLESQNYDEDTSMEILLVDKIDENIEKVNISNETLMVADEEKIAKIENVIKSVDKQFVDIGDIITYNISFENKGNVPAQNIIITDLIPSGFSYIENSLVSNMAIIGSPVTNISFNEPLAVDQSVIVEFKVKIDEIPVGHLNQNKGIIEYNYIVSPEKLPVMSSIEINNVIVNVKHGEISTSGLDSISKSADRAITTSGEEITYTIRAKNIGNSKIENIMVKDILPSGTSFVVGSTMINGTPSNQNPIVGINILALQANEQLVVRFKVLVLENAPSKIVNSAMISYEYSVNPNYPMKKVEFKTDDFVVENLSPKIEIIKKADKKVVILGEIINYSLDILNNGEVTALDLIIKDQLQAGLEYINNLTINGVPFNGDITLGINIPSLAPKEKVSIAFGVKVNKSIGKSFEFSNKAKGVYNYQAQVDSTIFSKNVESNEIIIKCLEALVLIKKNTDKELIKFGDTFIYTIEIENKSSMDAEKILLKDSFPNELEIQEIKVDGITITGNIEQGLLVGPLMRESKLIVTVFVKAINQLNEPFKGVVDAKVFFRPDLNRALVEVDIKAEDRGIVEKYHKKLYQGIVVVQPNLKIVKTADKKQVAVCECIKYTLNIQNTGNVDVYNVVMRDIINEKLKFIVGSIEINGINAPTQDIFSGVSIESIGVNEIVNISFEAEVLKSGDIANQALVEYIYKSETDGIDQAGFNESNKEVIKANDVKLEVVKISDKKFAVLRDEIKYTITIRNKTKIVANNIIVKDELPGYLELIPYTFKLNGQLINAVNISNGINIGILKPNQVSIIEYKIKIISNPCISTIENRVKVNYNYVLPNGALGKIALSEAEIQTDSIDLGKSNFKQFNVESYLTIPDNRPDIENINIAKGTFDIKNYHIIKTATNLSNEGQYLTGHKLIVTGCLNFIIEYTALNLEEAIYSAHYCIPFSTFVVLPKDYAVGSKIDVQGGVEDIYFKAVSEREFFANVSGLINVKILFYQ
ncbi:MAG: DUF7507 domain-containing protein [Sarcina sp.]